MNNISGFVVLMVLGGSLIILTLYRLRASIRKLFSGHYFREDLKNQVTHSRLGKMLAKKNIDLEYYLFSLPDAEIMKHILNCKHCHRLDQCDYYLGKKEMGNKADPPFCPNNDSLTKIKNQQKSHTS